jgi:voltage-gated potassium channel
VGAEEPIGEQMEQAAVMSADEHQVRDAYGLALILLLLSTLGLIAAGVPVSSPLAVGAAALQVLALVLTLRVSGVRLLTFRVGIVVLGALFLASVVLSQVRGDTTTVVSVALWLVLTLTTIGAIGKRLATYRRVTLQLVLGLLCIYLLIGLSFSLAYLIVDMVAPSSFDPWPLKISGCVYYSFITLATVGYGDVSPVAPIARSLAVAESILGQLYLVSVVSLAVSRLGRERPKNPLEEAE